MKYDEFFVYKLMIKVWQILKREGANHVFWGLRKKIYPDLSIALRVRKVLTLQRV